MFIYVYDYMHGKTFKDLYTKVSIVLWIKELWVIFISPPFDYLYFKSLFLWTRAVDITWAS